MSQAGKIGSTVGLGVITSPGCPNVLVEGVPLSVLGDIVSPHGIPPHDSALISTGSATVTAGSLPVTRVGDLATCGDVVSTGALSVEVT